MNRDMQKELQQLMEKTRNGLSVLDAYYYLASLMEAEGLRNDPTAISILNSIKSPSANIVTVNRAINLISQRAIKASLNRKRSIVKQNNPDIIPLGKDEENTEWGIVVKNLPRHVLIVGGTGSGKTHLLLLLMRGLIHRKDQDSRFGNVWAFDFKKELRRLSMLENDVSVLMWDSFKFNPFRNPPGVKLSNWIQIIYDMIAQVFDLKLSSKFLLINYTHHLLQEYKTEQSGNYPSMLDLHELLKAKSIDRTLPAGEKEKILTCLNKTEAIVNRIGSIIDCSEGYCIEDMLEQNIIFEFDGLSTDMQKFLVSSILLYVFHHYLASDLRGKLNLAVIIDECKFIFGKGV